MPVTPPNIPHYENDGLHDPEPQRPSIEVSADRMVIPVGLLEALINRLDTLEQIAIHLSDKIDALQLSANPNWWPDNPPRITAALREFRDATPPDWEE